MGGFVIIDKLEFSAKLKRLAQGLGTVYLWKRGEKNFPLTPRLFEEKGGGVFLLHFPAYKEMQMAVGQELLFYFMQGAIQYFGKGNLIKNDEAWVLEIRDEAFKREKRKNERLLTFPHHQVFAFFHNEKGDGPTNVISLDKTFEKKKSIFESFLKRQGHHEGFRVLDVSQNGFSFTASKNELASFNEGEVLPGRIKFNGEFFELPEIKIIHTVDYIDPRFGHIPMFKVGAQILKMDEFLKEKIALLLGEESRRVEVGNEFENFLK